MSRSLYEKKIDDAEIADSATAGNASSDCSSYQSILINADVADRGENRTNVNNESYEKKVLQADLDDANVENYAFNKTSYMCKLESADLADKIGNVTTSGKSNKPLHELEDPIISLYELKVEEENIEDALSIKPVPSKSIDLYSQIVEEADIIDKVEGAPFIASQIASHKTNLY